MKRVLHITEALGGGITTALDAYLRNAPETSSHTIVARVRSSHDTGSNLGSRAKLVLVEGSIMGLALRALSLARDAKPDLIHAHSSYGGLVGRILGFLLGVPVVYSPHAFAFLRTDLLGGRIAQTAIVGVETIAARFTSVFAVAGASEAAAARSLRPDAEVVILPPRVGALPCPNGVVGDTEKWDICTLGRIAPQKDFRYFLSVVEEMRSLGWKGRSLWIGDGPAEDREALIGAGVEVSGWVSRSVALSLLGQAQVYVHTARWEASIPYAVLEACAVRRPVVCRDIPPMRDRAGLLLGDSPSEVADITVRLLKDPNDVERALQKVSNDVLSNEWSTLLRLSLSRLYS